MIIWSLIKKLYKLAIIFGVCSVVYIVYIYIENPKQAEKQIKQSIEDFGKKAKDVIPNLEKKITQGIKDLGEKAKNNFPNLEGR